MARTTGIVLAAGGIAAANELVFAPVTGDIGSSFNWRLIPATAVLALALGGLEKAAPDFAVGLASLSLAVVLLTPLGKTSNPPLTNIAKALGYSK